MADEVSAEDVVSLGRFYELIVYLAAAAGIALYVQMLRSRRLWVMVEACIGGGCVVGFVYGKTVMSYYNQGTEDSLSIYLVQMVFGGLASRATAIILTRNSLDPSVAVGIYVSNILERGTVLICIMYSILYLGTLPQFSLKMDFLFYFLLVFGDVTHLSKVTTRDGRITVRGPIRKHLAFDAVVSFVFGTFLLGFSSLFIELMNPEFNSSELNIILTKSVGCLLAGGSLLSLFSLCFRDITDSIAILQARLVMYISTLILSVLYYEEDEYRTPGHVCLIMGVVGILAINAESAVWRKQTKLD